MPFAPGQSGNPSGRPKTDYRVRDLARAQTENAIATLVRCMEDGDAPWAPRVAAASTILDRGWGKAPQPMTGEPQDDEMGQPTFGPVEIRIVRAPSRSPGKA